MDKAPDKETKKEIVAFCRRTINKLNLSYLKDNGVFKNEFLEYLYMNCVRNWNEKGTYILSDEDVSILFSVKKQNEQLMAKTKNGEYKISAIDKYDNLTLDKNK
jgi:hypothetical protein